MQLTPTTSMPPMNHLGYSRTGELLGAPTSPKVAGSIQAAGHSSSSLVLDSSSRGTFATKGAAVAAATSGAYTGLATHATAVVHTEQGWELHSAWSAWEKPHAGRVPSAGWKTWEYSAMPADEVPSAISSPYAALEAVAIGAKLVMVVHPPVA